MSAVLNAPTSPDPAAAGLDLRPLAGRIGAEVRGIRLSGEIDAATFDAVRCALLRHKVLFFRGQRHLDDASHQAFGRRWGEIVAHPTVPAPEGTKIFELDSQHGGRANSWHTDVTFEAAPPKVSILRALVIPPLGGDTVWANTAAAYDGLPAPLRALADSLWGVHGNDYDYGATRVDPDTQGVKHYREVFTRRLIQAEHPLVRVHPETGERSLVAGHFLKKFIGFNTQDSQHLIGIFQHHVTRLENTVRWAWTEGDVAIWDNRATQHYAINDYGDAHRLMRRVTVAGEPTVAVDGQRGRPATASH